MRKGTAAEPTFREIQAVRRWLTPRWVVLVVALLFAISVFAGRRFLDNLPETRPILRANEAVTARLKTITARFRTS